jgi:acyl-CoA hydrolase
MERKPVKSTLTVMTELVLPNDTNNLGNLMGGNLLRWMDIASSVSAMKHCGTQVVTAAVDSVSFREPIRLSDIVCIEAQITRTFHTSMEIYMEVFRESVKLNERKKSNIAYYTFVSLDANGKPQPVAEVIPETNEEKERYAVALRRRQLRLILAGRMKPEDATELKSLFLKDVIPE